MAPPPNPREGRPASVHTHVSNRDRARAGSQLDRKIVHKSVLDNPFHVPWPVVPLNVQNALLSQCIRALDGVSGYHLSRRLHGRHKKKARRAAKASSTDATSGDVKSVSNSKKRLRGVRDEEEEGEPLSKRQRSEAVPSSTASPRPTSATGVPEDLALTQAPPEDLLQLSAPISVPLPPPAALGHLAIGINNVTRRLEAQAKAARHRTISSDAPFKPDTADAYSASPLQLVLACTADIGNPALLAHLPHLVAACNSAYRPGIPAPSNVSSPSSRQSPDYIIKLVTLPKGAELALAGALGLRRVAVMGFDNTAPGLSSFSSLLHTVPAISAQWLSPAIQSVVLEPTHIKQLRTSAPKDMKAAKEQRTLGRTTAKEHQKQKQKDKAEHGKAKQGGAKKAQKQLPKQIRGSQAGLVEGRAKPSSGAEHRTAIDSESQMET